MRTALMRTLTLAGVLALGACAYPNPAHVAALNALVGKSEQDLVKAYGVPNRSIDTGGHRYLAYSRSRIETLPGSPGFGPWGPYYGYWGGWGGWGGGWGGFPPEVVTRDCETTFDLKGGIVQSWGLRGNAC